MISTFSHPWRGGGGGGGEEGVEIEDAGTMTQILMEEWRKEESAR